MSFATGYAVKPRTCAQMLVDIACDYLVEMGKMMEIMQESRIKIPR